MVAVVQRHGLSNRTLVLTLAAWAVAFSDVAVQQYNEGAWLATQHAEANVTACRNLLHMPCGAHRHVGHATHPICTALIQNSGTMQSMYGAGALQKAEVFGQPLPGWLQTALEPPQWVPRSQLHMKPGAGNMLSPPAGSTAAQPAEVTHAAAAHTLKGHS
jgi:hypothetical protein